MTEWKNLNSIPVITRDITFNWQDMHERHEAKSPDDVTMRDHHTQPPTPPQSEMFYQTLKMAKVMRKEIWVGDIDE